MSDEAPAAVAPSARLTPATAVVLVLGGVVLGLFGGFLSAVTVIVAGIELPIGLVVILAALVSCIRAAVHLFGLRRAGVLFLAGWVVATVALALPGPGGDVVIAANTVAMVYLFGGVIVGTACANVPASLTGARAVKEEPAGSTEDVPQ